MACARCGCEQIPGAQFCRQCGVTLGAAAPLPPMYPPMAAYWPAPRVRQNLQPLGILWCVYGAYRLISLLFGVVMLHTLMASGFLGGLPYPVQQMIHAGAPMVLFLGMVTAVVGIITGYALLTRRSWARVLAIVMAILSLIKIPFGTALGIYTLYVLAPQTSGVEWDAITCDQV